LTIDSAISEFGDPEKQQARAWPLDTDLPCFNVAPQEPTELRADRLAGTVPPTGAHGWSLRLYEQLRDHQLAAATALSLVLHALILSLQLGGEAPGWPGLDVPWRERRMQAPPVQIHLEPAAASSKQALANVPSSETTRSSNRTPTPSPAAVTLPSSAQDSILTFSPSPALAPPDASPTGKSAARRLSRPSRQAQATLAPKGRAATTAQPTMQAPPDTSPALAPMVPANLRADSVVAAPAEEPITQVIAAGQGREAEFTVPPLPPSARATLAAQNLAALPPLATSSPTAAPPIDSALVAAQQRASELARELAEQQTRQDAAERAARLDAAVQLAAAAQVEAARRDAERELAERHIAERQLSQQRDAAREEAARREAASLEAAKQETAARGLARQAAASQEAAQLEAAQQEAQKQNAAKQEAAKQEAAKQEAARQEAAQQATARRDSVERELALQEAARQEASRQEAARQQAARDEAARLQAARAEAAKADDARRDASRRAMGRQLDEEAARRDAAEAASKLAPSASTLRRGRLFGRTDANSELVLYAEAWARKLQLNMTFDMVREAARKPHADPVVLVAVRSDGSVEAISFVVSSGVPELDEAIRGVVRSQTPFAPFSPALARQYDVVEIRRTWRFDSAIRLF